MKKYLILSALFAAFACMSITAHAQSSPYGNGQRFLLAAGDTVTTTDSCIKIINATGGYRDLGVQVYLNKLSGTPAGKLILLSSMDGVTYTQTDSIALASPPVNSKTTPAAFLTAQLSKTGTPFTYYMVIITNTAATSSGQVRVWYTLRRQLTTQVN
jgi:hypothetical protein